MFDFEQMKFDLFTQSRYTQLSEKTITKNQKCLLELAKIGYGLSKFDEWAIKSNTLNYSGAASFRYKKKNDVNVPCFDFF